MKKISAVGLMFLACIATAQDFVLPTPIVTVQTTIVNRVSADRVMLNFSKLLEKDFLVAYYSYHDTTGNVTQSGAIPLSLAEVSTLGAGAGVDVAAMLQQMMGIANVMLEKALNPPPPPPPPPPTPVEE